jgi:hypothetical protein
MQQRANQARSVAYLDGYIDESANMMEESSGTESAGIGKVCSDAGASSVMTPDIDRVTNFRPKMETISLANGSKITSIGRGQWGRIPNVMVAPDLNCNRI